MSLFAKKSFVGVDLGHHTMKVAQIERTASGWRVSKYATAPTPIDTIRDGIVVDPPVLGIALKNLLKEAHIGATNASIAVSGGTVVVRPVRIPKMAESALRKSIRFEASRYVPNSVEDSYIEFEIVKDSDETNMDVLISAAPKELVDSRMKACVAAGLEIENVEIGAFAAYRAVVEADPTQDWSEKTVALLDIGASTSNLSIVSHGAFSMTRAIPNGGQVLTDTLKNYFKLSSEDAERGKAQLDVTGLIGDAKVIENPPLRVLHSHLDDMVREVRRSINYWQSQQTEGTGPKQIDQIMMSGGGAQMPGLSAYFEHKLGIPTRACGVFDNVRFIGSHSEDDHGFQLALASGLAMAMASTKVAVAQKAPKSVDVKPAKAAKPPRAPKPPKGGVSKAEDEAPIEVTAPPVAELLPSFDAEVQVPAAFQSAVPAATAPAAEPEIAAPTTVPTMDQANSDVPSFDDEPIAELPPIEAPRVELPQVEGFDNATARPVLEVPSLEAELIAELPPIQAAKVELPNLESFDDSAVRPMVEVPSFEAEPMAELSEVQAPLGELAHLGSFDVSEKQPMAAAPSLEAEPMAELPPVQAPKVELPHLESFDDPAALVIVPSELQKALDAVLDLERAAQEALLAPAEPTPAPVPAPVVEKAPEPAPAASAVKPAKKPLLSSFSFGAKKPKTAKASKPGRAAKDVKREKPAKPAKATAEPQSGLKTAKPGKAPLFSFSFKGKAKASPVPPATSQAPIAPPVVPAVAASKPKLGLSLFKKRKPDETNEAPKKEAA